MSEHSRIASVSVVGAGTLGSQIAAMTAHSGRIVRLYDVQPNAASAALERLRTMLEPVIADGKLDWDLDEVLTRIHPVAELAESLDGADLVIEAIREDLETKRAALAEISALAPDILIATNSSSIPSSRLASAVINPGNLANLHFFSSFWQRSMVELMSCGHTTPDTMAVLEEFGNSLGLFTAVVNGESKGFIINRIWRAVKRESLRVVDEDVADAETVDRLWAMFWNTDIGPFGMMDEVGLNVVADIEQSYMAISSDPTDVPSKSLHDLVDTGHLGQKTGSGFYDYPNPEFRAPGWPRHTVGSHSSVMSSEVETSLSGDGLPGTDQ